MKQEVKTMNDVKLCIGSFIKKLGDAFHPDTSFFNYVDEHNNPTFSEKESINLDKALDTCFIICKENNIDIYGLTVDLKLQYERTPLSEYVEDIYEIHGAGGNSHDAIQLKNGKVIIIGSGIITIYNNMDEFETGQPLTVTDL